jgi:t-SNARE complex subunit (syntaxin)
MADLNDLQSRRDALVKKREGLVSRVRTGDKTVVYDLSQVNEALRELDRQIERARGTQVRRVRIVSDKGW